jgi:hypothetical protein
VLSFHSHLFNELNAKEGVIRITKAGGDNGADAAEWEYFYKSDPSTILGTGVVGKSTTLPDETLMISQVQRRLISLTPGVPNNVALIRDSSYTYDQGARLTTEVIVDPNAPEDEPPEDHLKLKTTWVFDDGSTSQSIVEPKTGQYFNIGHGIRMYFYRDRLEAQGGFQLRLSGRHL